MFWTLDSNSDPLGPVTLCERHALEATNIPCKLFGLGPYESMEQAALELEAISAIFGNDSVTFGFTTSEQGHCEVCAFEALEAGAASEDGAA